MRRINQLRRELVRARQILALYDSSIADAAERKKRTEQERYIRQLERQLVAERVKEDEDPDRKVRRRRK
jgi:transcription elongation GreA/GreB family factor